MSLLSLNLTKLIHLNIQLNIGYWRNLQFEVVLLFYKFFC